ncbi:hypothetical protein Dimus_021140 [Dionaea muscipula]
MKLYIKKMKLMLYLRVPFEIDEIVPLNDPSGAYETIEFNEIIPTKMMKLLAFRDQLMRKRKERMILRTLPPSPPPATPSPPPVTPSPPQTAHLHHRRLHLHYRALISTTDDSSPPPATSSSPLEAPSSNEGYDVRVFIYLDEGNRKEILQREPTVADVFLRTHRRDDGGEGTFVDLRSKATYETFVRLRDEALASEGGESSSSSSEITRKVCERMHEYYTSTISTVFTELGLAMTPAPPPRSIPEPPSFSTHVHHRDPLNAPSTSQSNAHDDDDDASLEESQED